MRRTRPASLSSLPRVAAAAVTLAAVLAAQKPAVASPDEALAEATWQTEQVGVGVVLERAHVASLFDAPQNLCVLRADAPGKSLRLGIACLDGPGCERTSSMAARRGALAAVNGGFFHVKTEVPVGLLIADGVLRYEQTDKVTAAIGIDRRGEVHIEDRAPGGWPKMHEARGSYPVVLRKGKPVEKQGWGAADKRHPRTAVGLTKKGRLLFVTVDGRSEQAAGMTLLELALVMRWLGCDTAMNLDGGGSTTMWLRQHGVVNCPSDNQRFDHAGERPVTDALCLYAKMILEQDEERAALTPPTGWNSVAARRAVGGDCLLQEGEGDAVARFTFTVGAAGTFELAACWPKVRGRACDVEWSLSDDARGVVSGRRAAERWLRVEEVTLQPGAHELVLRRKGAGAFGVDAVRLTER